ncbi:MAG: cupredoxin domain-containing protein [Nitriliruptorales bacterium]|nr:cupredoxin domain-containing protein [Nitriliruptorales bacterium]
MTTQPPKETVQERPETIPPARGTDDKRSAGQWLALILGITALIAAGTLAVGSFGGGTPDEVAIAPAGSGETIAVSMTEFTFEPASLELSQGEYTFEITNDGQAPHQWALSAVGDHGTHLADTGEVAAGATTTLTVQLEGGVYEFACHLPGHYDAGMHGELAVAGADGTVPEPAEPAEHDDEGAAHDDGEAAHDDSEAAHDDGDAAAHDDSEAAHDDSEAAHDDEAAHEGEAAHDDPATGSAEVIEVSMTEFAYEPGDLELAAGTYTFVITNDGQVPHEWAMAEAGEHHGHGASTRQLAPGESQELTVELEPGEYAFMCHIDGHLEAGMEGTLTVNG